MNEKTVRVVGEVLRVRQAQEEKWGQKDHALPVWMLGLSEMAGDVAKGILDENAMIAAGSPRLALVSRRQEMRNDALGLAAVAVALVEYLDRHTCRSCGCTDEAGCAEGCWWTQPGLCSRCKAGEAEKAAGIAEVVTAGREAVKI